ncbi:hypothetical protein DM860_002067 [Cuscuta australis]|uniref:CASP-like protein n=1 Tax=Cuscuta australis TaxID=267555 RepID=A0A328DWW0_9ASTE|nr:hypothetical protein DM860_002067 [Cuscuta australis]
MAKTAASVAVRGVASVAYFAAAVSMLFAYQRSYVNGFIFKISFRDWVSFVLFAIANSLASAYNFSTLCIPSGSNLWRMVVLVDMASTIVLVSSLSVSAESYHLLNNGSPKVDWSAVCGVARHFCGVVLAALALGACGLLLNLGLLFYSLLIIFNPHSFGDFI